jgi:Patatin-like phospholipase
MKGSAVGPIGGDDRGFRRVLESEIAAINQRRSKTDRHLTFSDTIGLALSGGGIRSAAFSLGVLQALDRVGILKNVDYLSTVSGGGYIGASLTATMTKSCGSFVFRNSPTDLLTGTPSLLETGDSAAVGHLRNYSNYLLPPGGRYFGELTMTILRGVIPNFGLLLSILLVFSAFTILLNPDRSSLACTSVIGLSLCDKGFKTFGITSILGALGIMVVLMSAIMRSHSRRRSLGQGSLLANVFVILFAAVFFIEAQSILIEGMFRADVEPTLNVTSWVKHLAIIAIPIAAIVTLFSAQLGEWVKASVDSGYSGPRLVAFVMQASIWVAAAALPLLIWVIYLYLAYWGIFNDWLTPGESDPFAHTPTWLLATADIVSSRVIDFLGYIPESVRLRLEARPLIVLYLCVALVLILLSWLIKPNANSLHGAYRDRLGRAFLFDPGKVVEQDQKDSDEFRPLEMRLSQLSVTDAPYHLIGASLNIHGSVHANRRARNADFFLFSPLYVGSYVTGWAPTEQFERAAPDVDLATAMAISGAAVSANMQAASLRSMTPTLALLNVSLGYWLKNPRYLQPNASVSHGIWRGLSRLLVNRLTVSLWSQMTGRLQENSEEIYVTDGGHLENLGVYELLRRRCAVIIVVDAEADPYMYFNSFVKVQRYARIDLGIRIDMPWESVQRATLQWMGYDAQHNLLKQQEPTHGPHAVIGTIDYGSGATGFLVYIKSSLTGDETNYVRDYARRHRKFPHEDTGNQFFNEEQFEVYRALGAHIGNNLFSGRDTVWIAGRGFEPPTQTTFEDDLYVIKEIRNKLGIRVPPRE